MDITWGVADKIKPGVDEVSGQVLSGVKVYCRLLVEFLWEKFGIEVGPFVGMLDERYLWNIAVGYWKIKIYGSPLGLFQLQMRISFPFLRAKHLRTSLLIMRTRSFLLSCM